MASNDNSRGKLLTAGGVLSIIAGAFEIISGGIVVALIMSPGIRRWLLPLPPMPLMPGDWYEYVIPVVPAPFISVGIAFIVWGVGAIIGGISAVNRKSFGLSLVGAICALPSIIMGILAIIFVSLGKREFRAVRG